MHPLSPKSTYHEVDLNPEQRLFSEREAATILERAVALHEAHPTSDYSPGITREELERIVLEAGVDRQSLELAIRELSLERTKQRGLSEDFESILEGQLTSEGLGEFYDELRNTKGYTIGQVHEVGSTFTATVGHQIDSYALTISSRKGRTRIRVRAITAGPVIVATVWFFGAAILVSLGKVLNPFLTIGLFLAWSVGLYFWGRATLKVSRKRSGKVFHFLSNLIARHVEGDGMQTTQTEASLAEPTVQSRA